MDKKKKKENLKTKSKVRYTNVKDMDDFFKIVNKIQLNKKEVRILVKDDSVKEIIENTLKDLSLEYKKMSYVSKVVYRIYPNNIEFNKDITEEDFNEEFNL
jgi:hypothetical protein